LHAADALTRKTLKDRSKDKAASNGGLHLSCSDSTNLGPLHKFVILCAAEDLLFFRLTIKLVAKYILNVWIRSIDDS